MSCYKTVKKRLDSGAYRETNLLRTIFSLKWKNSFNLKYQFTFCGKNVKKYFLLLHFTKELYNEQLFWWWERKWPNLNAVLMDWRLETFCCQVKEDAFVRIKYISFSKNHIYKYQGLRWFLCNAWKIINTVIFKFIIHSNWNKI